MNATWKVFRYEFLRQIRRRGFLFVSIGIPIIALVIFFAIRTIQQVQAEQAANNPASNTQEIAQDSPFGNLRPLGYVDLSGLLKPSPFNNLLRFESEAAAQDALKNEQISGYYIVARDYLQSGQIDMYFERFNLGSVDSAPLRMLIVQSLTERTGDSNDAAVAARLQDRRIGVTPHAISLSGQVQQTNEDVSFLLVYLFSMLLLLTAFTTSGYLMQSVVEEKENRMVEVLLSSMRPRDLLAGKFIAMSLLGLIQMVLWIGTTLFIISQLANLSPVLAGITISVSQLVVIVIYFILGYLFFGAAFAALGALATNMREGPQLAVVVTLPAVLPFYVMPVIVNTPNAPLPVFLSLFPLTAPLTMVMRVAAGEVPLAQIAIGVVLMLITIGGVIWLAARFFRVNTLLSGRMPRLRDIIKLVRESA